MRLSAIDILISNQNISADGNSRSIKSTWCDQLVGYINIDSVSGSNTPTMTVTLQTSPDNVNWYNTTDTVAPTAAGNFVIRSTNFGSFFRLAWALTGTSPVFNGVDISVQVKGER